jgi:ferrochelatase
MKTAIIIFNLGGPDSLDAVRPFLTNLFSDPGIIRLPNPARWALANFIAKKREPFAQEIYRQLGGRSPLLENTNAQAQVLEGALGEGFKTFIAMRYWKPFADETAAEVAAYAPDHILLLPLYPQYSTTTTASSVADWNRALRRTGCRAPVKTLCCYPTLPGFVSTLARLTGEAYDEAAKAGTPRILFSAHGLPERIIRKEGDPYQFQCEQTAKAIAAAMNQPGIEWLNTYQSRVGRLKWIGPYTDDEIRRAGEEKRPLVVVPIAFVSEHSETLVELDIEYGHLAREAGVPSYVRVPTASVQPEFIEGLAELARNALRQEGICQSQTGGRLCPDHFTGCAFRKICT